MIQGISIPTNAKLEAFYLIRLSIEKMNQYNLISLVNVMIHFISYFHINLSYLKFQELSVYM